ncbi:MFS transporter [Serratia sp. MYb239]|uniref:MFS transporter n=1 Tax=unclassified Serratia (in: enterobacteria) TaxID=2647522 RepID=UPI000CF68511|nr:MULTISPECIES: MFS transporter [unclassified Serratia (in: enterobacteria)]AVJ16818.1 MFS transporter [Serratia sp. MYb239]MCA4823181.1 MFS transporter [Serratia rubidaea]CAE1143940.1 Inner membrane metabolite transport protein ydjE [Serratia sp. Tan611]SQJ24282.1 Inner membrane metabolite transport protein ydjE [Serratia rubidaea]
MTTDIAAPSAAPSSAGNADSAGAASVTIRNAADVSRLVNSGAAKRSDARIVVAIALGGVFLDAYDLGALAFGIKDVAREFSLSPTGTGLVASAITFGAIIGAFIGGYLTDKIGRYRVFMADMFFFVVAALACAFAPNEWVLGGARFVMGLGVGIDLPVAMAFLAEFSRLSGRGNKAARIAMWCPTWYAAISISYLLVLLLYAVLPDGHTDWLWRLILGFGAVPALLIIAIRSRYMSESPVWAANQGDLQGAAAILRRSYNIHAQVAEEAERTPAAPARRAAWRNYGELLKGVYLRRTVLATTIAIASSFAYNAVAFGLPVILSTFLAQSMLSTILVSLALNLLFAFAGGLLAVRLVPTFGAWKMTVLGYACQLAALLGLALVGLPDDGGEAAFSIGMLALFLLGQGFGPGSHSMTFASLSYPTSLRGVGVGFNQTLMRASSTLSLFLFPVLSAALGTGVFWVIALAPLVGLVALLAIRWEPAGYDVDAEDFRPV